MTVPILFLALGDGCLERGVTGARLTMTHSAKQAGYLRAKMMLLGLPYSTGEKTIRGYPAVWAKTRMHPDFLKVYYDLYPGGKKKIRLDHLQSLTDLGWALLFGDDGSLQGHRVVEQLCFYFSNKIVEDGEGLRPAFEQFGGVHIKLQPTRVWRFGLEKLAGMRLMERMRPYLLSLDMGEKTQ